MTLLEISESVHVEAPPDAVWALVTDVPRHTEFAGPRSVTKSIDCSGPAGLGSRWTAQEKLGPRRLDAPSEVIEVERGRQFGWVTFLPVKERDSGVGGRVYWAYRLEPEAGGTRLVHRMRVEEPRRGAVMMKAAYRVLNLPVRRRQAMLTTLANIKAAAEASRPA